MIKKIVAQTGQDSVFDIVVWWTELYDIQIHVHLLSCVGFIEIELVFNINMQSVKARSQSIRQGLFQNIFGGLMANYLIFKNLLKEQNLKLFEKWVYYLGWWQDWWKMYLARKVNLYIYSEKSCERIKKEGLRIYEVLCNMFAYIL